MNFLQVFIQTSDIVMGIVLIGVLAFIIGGGIATLVTYLMARKTQSKAKSYYRNVFLIAGAMSVIPICIILLYFLSL
ncbi:hypothetical protein SAMN05421786_11463 [Chryseobacterium ureilyticum]|uniref:Uncharacterized protein n=1 Tax=Chryseobacterium ureilyticum TaxID=373668 RepID=A0A1N7QQX0_9FLAO|nr:hypothetical protein [Chryseobacterium ureilyticum]SIT25169.1 hypothetical protein SAMN05421786_11463 [Chryseobacterium ureilyticum]